MKLSVENGSFYYKKNMPIFENINFEVKEGEILAILGPNGAGKTTMLRCITGMLKWKSGQSLLDGEPIHSMSPRKLWSRMAYVPQAKAASSAYTAFETVLLGRSGRLGAFATPGKADLEKAREVMELLGIGKLMDKKCSAISGGELLIPDNFMGLIRENVPLYSKLYKHVFVRRLKGKGRQLIPGTIPEAVWTEMCGELNEMSLSFSGVQLDGYKVGGFVAVCNAMLEDSDIDLAQEVLTSITKSIAQALDKAILYGTGKMMPLGIVPRLAQTAKPDGYVHKLAWKDVHETNMISLASKTGKALFQALVEASGKINTDYGDGEIFWAMKRSTKMKLISQSMDVNSSGTIVAGMNNTMPVVGGEIETLSFIPDDVIIGGGEGLYSLLERAGMSLASFNQTLAIKDQTLFIGTARYDGLPVIADGFVAISLNATLPSPTAVTFAADKANSGT